MGEGATHDAVVAPQEAALLAALGRRSIVLVGMMGAGKSSIGRRLAQRLGIGVRRCGRRDRGGGRHDHRGDLQHLWRAGFPLRRGARDRPPARPGPAGAGDRRRRLHESPIPAPASAPKGVSVWLKADFEVLMRRVKRRATADRPMLQGDPAQRIRHLMDERYPVYAEADVTVMSREVSHEIIVNEIVAELAARSRRCGRACERRGGRAMMTAPLRVGETTTVPVALGARAYDIVIGRGLLAELGKRIAALKPGASAAIVTDETVAARHLEAAEAALAAAGIRATRDRRAAGRGVEELAHAARGLRPAARCAHRAQRCRRRARRRRGRRPRRFRGRDPAPRPRCRAGADHVAGAGRFFGRRQDRHQFRATARISSARSISRSW